MNIRHLTLKTARKFRKKENTSQLDLNPDRVNGVNKKEEVKGWRIAN